MRWTKLVAVVVLVGIGVLAGWQITRHTPPAHVEAVADAPREEPPKPEPQKPEPPKAEAPKPPPMAVPLLPLPPIDLVPKTPVVPVTPIAFSPPVGQPPPVVPSLPSPNELIPTPAIPVAPAAPKLTPLTAAADGAPVSYVNTPRVSVDYEVTKKGASGLGTVELWLKDANGWSWVTTASSNQRLEADLPADGVYGAKVVPVSGLGVRGPEPAKDALPDLWIVRDTTPPHVSLKVTPATEEGDKPAPFVVEITIKDVNLDPDTLVVDCSGDVRVPAAPLFNAKDLGKEKIETKLGVFVPRKNDVLPPYPADLRVVLDWTPAGETPPRVNLGVAAKDRAGNAYSVWQTNIGTDLTEPAARVTGVRALPPR